jgi:biotin operon repressor
MNERIHSRMGYTRANIDKKITFLRKKAFFALIN